MWLLIDKSIIIIPLIVSFCNALDLAIASTNASSTTPLPSPLVASTSTKAPAAAMSSLMDVLAAGGFTMMADALKMNNLSDINGPMTVFVAPNSAFNNIKMSSNNNPDVIKKSLQCHFVMRLLALSDIRNDRTVPSLSGDRMRFNIYGNLMTLNGIPITAQPQLDTSSSIKVYLIDGLLSSPPTKIDHLMDVLAANVDEYHMLIHAIHITGLTMTIEEGSPFTLFAPTNAAFQALPHNALVDLMSNNDLLKKVVLDHLVRGTYFLRGLKSEMMLHTMMDRGSFVKVLVDGNITMINGAHILHPDMVAPNGVVHGIHHVLLMS